MLFTPFRALGYVTIDVPFSLQLRGSKSYFLTTCINRSFQIYDVEKFNLLFVGPLAPGAITAIASLGDFTFAATGSLIIVYHRAKELYRLTARDMDFEEVEGSTFLITELTILGDLIFAICDDNVVRMWNHSTREFHNEIAFGPQFEVTSLLHPSAYLNKILLSSRQGKFQLWNVSSMRCIHEFATSFDEPITFLAQSPVVDIVAIGTLSGKISLHNIKTDKAMFSLHQEGKVTAISFRTDEFPMMATSSMNGDIAIWDLEKRTLFHTISHAHDAAVQSAQFLNGSPILLTSGSDNSIKQWVFDGLEGLPRLLKSRSGHQAAPTSIRHYGDCGNNILSGGGNDKTIRSFSVIRDSQSVELSQGSLAKKAAKKNVSLDYMRLPPILQFGHATLKEKDWDNIVTCHSNASTARVWSFDRKAIGQHVLKSPDDSNIKAVAMSQCGNHAFVGSAMGNIAQYNMQSGLFKMKYIGHEKPISSMCTDSLSQRLFSSSLDGRVKVWNIKSGKLITTLDFKTPISRILIHLESGLLAVVADDLCIRVVDTDTFTIVREFYGHRNRILDLTFSSDARWIISTSLDSTIRTWDLPTGCMVDCFKSDTIATSLSLSPTGDFLATSHVDRLGIFLWANKSQFTSVSLKPIDDDSEVLYAKLPNVGTEEEGDDEEVPIAEFADNPLALSANIEISNAPDLADEMISISSLPTSRWQNLLNLESIKKRNKPKEKPKAPQAAPFFLPMVSGLVPKFDLKDADAGGDANEPSKLHRMNDMDMVTEFSRKLRAGGEDEDFSPFFAYIKSLSPSALSLELESMSTSDDLLEIRLFVRAMKSQLVLQKDFELVQAYLSAFLKINGEVILENADIFSQAEVELKGILLEHGQGWTRLERLLQSNLCGLDFVRKST